MFFSPIDLAVWQSRQNTFDFQGHDIAYWDSGHGKPLLLVHGYPTASWDWSCIWEPLAQTRRVIACDMLGFGFSDKPPSGYSIHRQTDLQEALLIHLSVGSFDAVVHDYGVSVGQELLARCNAGGDRLRLDSILFLNGGLQPDMHRPRLLQKIGSSPIGWILGYLINRKRFGKAFSAVFGPNTQPTESELDAFWSLITHNDGHKRMHALLHYMKDRKTYRNRWLSALRNTQIPIGLINGALDPVSGHHLYQKIIRLVPEFEAVSLDDVGHYPQTEAPDRVFREIIAFLQRHAK